MQCIFTRALLVGVILSLTTTSRSAEPTKAKPEPVKPAKKSPGAAGKVESQLAKAFKLWDRNKDDAVDKDELEKVFVPKAASKKGPAAAAAADPRPAIAALHAKLDEDKDGKVNAKEFDAWATTFAAYLTKFAELQERRAGIERELVNLQRLLAKSDNVSAADGIFAGEANRGIIRYQGMLKDIDNELKELADKGGHTEYAQMVAQQVFR